MNNLVRKIDQMIEERSLLNHPFYEMWSDGKLSLDSLAGYSKEYFQVVKEVPKFMSKIIENSPNSVINELRANQQEEFEHIQPWVEFAGSLGINENDLKNYTGLEKTRKAVSHLSSLMNTFANGACAMYAFEKELPKISQIKLEGLVKFYGINSKEATRYFELHTEADIRHAASWRSILEKSSSEQELLNIAEQSISAQHLLLDSCYEAYC